MTDQRILTLNIGSRSWGSSSSLLLTSCLFNALTASVILLNFSPSSSMFARDSESNPGMMRPGASAGPNPPPYGPIIPLFIILLDGPFSPFLSLSNLGAVTVIPTMVDSRRKVLVMILELLNCNWWLSPQNTIHQKFRYCSI